MQNTLKNRFWLGDDIKFYKFLSTLIFACCFPLTKWQMKTSRQNQKKGHRRGKRVYISVSESMCTRTHIINKKVKWKGFNKKQLNMMPRWSVAPNCQESLFWKQTPETEINEVALIRHLVIVLHWWLSDEYETALSNSQLHILNEDKTTQNRKHQGDF